MDTGNSEMPCKIRKRRFPTASTSSFANNSSLSNQELLVEKRHSYSERNEHKSDRSTCKDDESAASVQKSGGEVLRVNELIDKSITNMDRSRNNPGFVYTPEMMNRHCRRSSSFIATDECFRGMHLICDAKPFEDNYQHCGEVGKETKNHRHPVPKSLPSLDEINHSLTISKELLKVLTRIWTTDTDHSRHPTSSSLVSALNHELNKARSHVNRLIQDQRSNNIDAFDSKEQDSVRVAVKTVTQELEVERKLRRQTERMNKKLGRELANTKSFLSKALKKVESDKRESEILEQLCEEMAHGIEENRVEFEELKKESERVREEMEEEKEMLRVADMLREERLQMKLSDAKYEYEDKHKQLNIVIHNLEDLLKTDNDGVLVIDHLKRTLKGLLWPQNNENAENEAVVDENALTNKATCLLWHQNIGNDKNALREEPMSMQHEGVDLLERYSSDCIEWELKFDPKNENEDEDNVLGFPCVDQTKEYEDEMERYKMIKDLRDHIVSGSGLTVSQGFVMLQEATQGQ